MASVEDFMEFTVPQWGTEVQIERRNRIKLSIAAYAYEFGKPNTMTDAEFDALSAKINPNIETTSDITDPKQKARYRDLDNFFSIEYSNYTGQWIHKHPELDLVEKTYRKFYGKSKV